MKVGIAAMALSVAGLGVAGMCTALGTAQAAPYAGGDCPAGQTCSRWCPGDSIQDVQGANWDWNACHDWTFSAAGIVDVGNGAVAYPYPNGPIPPAGPRIPKPPPPYCPPWATIFSGPAECGGL
jgi:hypothetical protein